jgi:hypothetical protein
MRLLLTCLLILFFAAGCSDDTSPDATSENTEASQAQAPQTNSVPVPADIDKKFNKIMDEYEKKISNNFWSKEEYQTTFHMNKYDNFMKKKGFTEIPNTYNYKGNIDNVEVIIEHTTVTGDRGGWIQKFTIKTQTTSEQGTFKKERTFETDRN